MIFLDEVRMRDGVFAALRDIAIHEERHVTQHAEVPHRADPCGRILCSKMMARNATDESEAQNEETDDDRFGNDFRLRWT